MAKSSAKHLNSATKWQAKHRKRATNNHRNWVKNHPSQAKQRAQNWQKQNKSKLSKNSKRWYKQNKRQARIRGYLSKARTYVRHYASRRDMLKLNNIFETAHHQQIHPSLSQRKNNNRQPVNNKAKQYFTKAKTYIRHYSTKTDMENLNKLFNKINK